ncbi:uncharacterized protein LOC129749760 [Uranotaenia lowii]|uniref:uncharacterized protein LOC129749760 n=1 Tax=Uranotaenia lowii TaxID=190385 RepID=UPI0024784074|nr:uncharacterized protein LOC129749760 [Uranotaenia lowii]
MTVMRTEARQRKKPRMRSVPIRNHWQTMMVYDRLESLIRDAALVPSRNNRGHGRSTHTRSNSLGGSCLAAHTVHPATSAANAKYLYICSKYESNITTSMNKRTDEASQSTADMQVKIPPPCRTNNGTVHGPHRVVFDISHAH